MQKLFFITLAVLLFSAVGFGQINGTNETNSTNQSNNTNITIPINDTNVTAPSNNTNVTLPGNDTNVTLPPGTLPSSPIWGINVAIDNLRLLLTFDRTARAEKGLQIAEKRLADIHAAAEAGDIQSVNKAKIEHDKILSKVREDVKIVLAVNNSTDTVRIKSVVKIGEQVDKYDLKVREATRSIDIQIRAKGDITPEQRAQIDAALQSIAEQSGDVKLQIRVKEGQLEIREKVKGVDIESETRLNIGKIKETDNDVQEKIEEKIKSDGSKSDESGKFKDSGSLGRSGNSGSSSGGKSDLGKGKSDK